jgi:hypothetical protein
MKDDPQKIKIKIKRIITVLELDVVPRKLEATVRCRNAS